MMHLRYQHVRNLLLVLLLLGSAGLLAYCCAKVGSNSEQAPATSTTPATPATSAASPGAPDPGMEQKIINLASSAAQPNQKVKDALKGNRWKVNLYEETGDQQYDRLKIDRDRNDVWDESWTFKQGRWEKEDGQFRSGSRWLKPGEVEAPTAPPSPSPSAATAAPVAPPTAPAATPAPADPLLRAAHRILTEKATGDKIKDMLGAGPKVNVYDDNRDGVWDRAKVSHARTDDWDEKWTVKEGRLERKLEQTGQIFIYQEGAWVEKK